VSVDHAKFLIVRYRVELFQINEDTRATHRTGQVVVTHHPPFQAASMKDV